MLKIQQLPRFSKIVIVGIRKFLDVYSNNFNPQAGGMAVAWPYGFEKFSRGHFTANKIQNVTNVKFRSLALIFNSKFDH